MMILLVHIPKGKDKVMVLGRDFENGKYVSSAMFVAQNYKK